MRCREGALGEPLAGTAPEARAWWFIEIPGSWGERAVESCRIPEVAALSSDAHRRILLIRRPGRHPAVAHDDPLRVWIADGAGGVPRAFRVPAAHLAGLGSPEASVWRCEHSVDDPRFLVCTNSARDACCGIDGRALVKTLTGLPGVWECSHLGGHRFAPTALHVVQGMAYGRLTAGVARDLIVSDLPDAAHAGVMRGSPALPPDLQAAHIAILRRHGRLPTSLERQGSEHAVYAVRASGGASNSTDNLEGRVSISKVDVGRWPVSCGRAPEPAVALGVEFSPT
jgi:hypothetical protein